MKPGVCPEQEYFRYTLIEGVVFGPEIFAVISC